MATAFWIADRHSYIVEAAASAQSLMRYMPDVRRILFSPDPQGDTGIFSQVRKLPPRQSEFWYVDTVRYMGLAVEGIRDDDRLLYLDTDTYVCAKLDDLFVMLDKFDFTGAHAPGRRTAPGADYIPPAFPEINVGVNAIRRNHATIWLMEEWLRRMEAEPKNNDQPALRAALWECSNTIRLGVLPPEYNMRWGFGGFARYPVKVLHGRGNYQEVERRLNAGKEMRGWTRGSLP